MLWLFIENLLFDNIICLMIRYFLSFGRIIVQNKTALPGDTAALLCKLGFVGMADSKCVTDVGHKVQLPLGPSTSRLSGKLGFVGVFTNAAPQAPCLSLWERCPRRGRRGCLW